MYPGSGLHFTRLDPAPNVMRRAYVNISNVMWLFGVKPRRRGAYVGLYAKIVPMAVSMLYRSATIAFAHARISCDSLSV
jgi:hypothetical protein